MNNDCVDKSMCAISRSVNELIQYTIMHKNEIDPIVDLDPNNQNSVLNLRIRFISDMLFCSYCDLPNVFFTNIIGVIESKIYSEENTTVLTVLNVLRSMFDINKRSHDFSKQNTQNSWTHFLFG